MSTIDYYANPDAPPPASESTAEAAARFPDRAEINNLVAQYGGLRARRILAGVRDGGDLRDEIRKVRNRIGLDAEYTRRGRRIVNPESPSQVF